jgi:hypothetical protein
MNTIKDLIEIKANFKPYYPVWLLKILSHGEYNKTVTISKFKLNRQQLTILSFVLLTIVMFISYTANDDKPTLIVWLGVASYLVFFSCVLLMMVLTHHTK